MTARLGSCSARRRPLLAAGLLALAAGCLRPPAPRTVPLRLGTTEIPLAVHAAGPSEPARPVRPAFLVLHANERTAVEAGLEILRSRTGRLVELQGQGRRLVTFELDGQAWRFDPNRIFTDVGAEATLQEHSGSAPPEVLAEIRDVASLQTIVTLHNNGEGEYSAASYLPGGELAQDAAAVHLPPEADPDDFFFVTDPALYDGLVAAGFTVVLQDNARVTDDGSLSVWAARQGIPYVNVEAQHGHRERQIEMLEALARLVEQRQASKN
jgi:hypothetical protein